MWHLCLHASYHFYCGKIGHWFRTSQFIFQDNNEKRTELLVSWKADSILVRFQFENFSWKVFPDFFSSQKFELNFDWQNVYICQLQSIWRETVTDRKGLKMRTCQFSMIDNSWILNEVPRHFVLPKNGYNLPKRGSYLLQQTAIKSWEMRDIDGISLNGVVGELYIR